MVNSDVKVIVILGPTASGKTELSLRLAEKWQGEVICADSRTIYRGMNIGTAKPDAAEQARVPHHLLDVIEPNETLSAARFKELAETAIQEISSRGRVPIIAGGSGLYIDSVVFDYKFAAEADPKYREELEKLSYFDLVQKLAEQDPEAYERVDLRNRRRVIRALETVGQNPSRLSAAPENFLVLGLAPSKEVVQKKGIRKSRKNA
jgi:tRNA dimethylallyltransferase